MARLARRRDRDKHELRRKTIVGVGLLCFVALVIGGVLAARMVLTGSKPKLDADYCPESGPTQVIAILIDRTDLLNPSQQQRIRQELEVIREGVPVGGAIDVYSIGLTDEELLTPEFRLCNPGRGEDVNALVGLPKFAEKRWRETFAEPLQKLFDEMVNGGESANSPIMESIQSVALTAFSGSKRKEAAKKLVIVSDMLQHTDSMSFYRKVPVFENFRKTEYYRKVRADLTGVRCEILYVRRETKRHIQGAAHINFWQLYFADQNGEITRVRMVEG